MKSTFALAAALESQKSFWKFIGVMMIVVMFIYAGLFFFDFTAF